VTLLAPRERRRRSRSLGLQAERVLAAILERADGTLLGPYETPQTDESTRPAGTFAAAEREHADGSSLFAHFGVGGRTVLAGRRVLDVGCGYGGRTVFYAEHCDAAEVHGVEPFEAMVERCRRFAAARGCANVHFEVARAEELPYPDESFDAVVSYDVLEHVDDPRVALREMGRVLRGGGSAWLVFPTYLSASAAHLDYVTRVPMLHRIFDPGTIVRVVNRRLEAEPDRFRVEPQPAPRVSALGHLTVPGLNGMSLAEARTFVAAAGLGIAREAIRPLFGPASSYPLGRPLSRLLGWVQRHRELPELLVGACAIHAVRPQ